MSIPMLKPCANIVGILFCLTKKNPLTLFTFNSETISLLNVNLKYKGLVSPSEKILILGNLKTPFVFDRFRSSIKMSAGK